MLFSHPVVSNTLRPFGLQNARSPCPSPSPEVWSSSCPCINDAIQPSHLLRASSISALNLSSIGDFSNESEIFPTSQLFSSVDQKYWHSRFSISPSNEYSGLISLKIDWFDDLAVKELLGVFSSNLFQRNQFFSTPPSLRSNSHNCW